MSKTDWHPVEPDIQTACSRFQLPLEEIAAGHIPAVVLRGAWSPQYCSDLVQRLIREELLYEAGKPVPPKFQKQSIPEGYYREGHSSVPSFAWQAQAATGKNRIDIGTSLGYRGSSPETFFSSSLETNRQFDRLFQDHPNPIRLLYESLAALAVNKSVVTAHEPDGSEYGAAIIRAHYGGYTYRPHFDSVRLREKRENYAVHSFEHQFAGVLVLQNSTAHGRTAQAILHQCLWEPELDPHLKAGTFYDYAAQKDLASVEVCLEPGDLYFFNTRCIHEVPGVAGDQPRIVLATFIGFSSDRDEIFVWS
ncbi:MAG: hypothetical protein VB858_08250 [Planctomycetaceae bacterium]